jgi:hypothetical protein
METYLSDEPESRQEIVLNDLRHKTDEELQCIVNQELELIRKLKRDDK